MNELEISYTRGQQTLERIERELVLRQAVGEKDAHTIIAVQDYADRDPLPAELQMRYDLGVEQWFALTSWSTRGAKHAMKAISLAFFYGRRKGWNACKKSLSPARSR